MTTQYDPNNDPFAAAVAAAESPDMRFGQIHVEARFVALVKGSGKVDFDAGIHDERFTEVSIRVDPLAETNRTMFDKREMLAEFGDFPKTVWASLKALGCGSVRDAHGRWCRYELVETGTYTNKNGKKRTSTTFKFHEFYADEAACGAAYRAYLDERYTVVSAVDNDPAMDVDMSPSGGNVHRDAEKETAKQFLAVLVKQHAGNREALKAAIESMPMVSRYFSVDSPEAQS